MEVALENNIIGIEDNIKLEVEGGDEKFRLASIGVAYTADSILWDNLGSNRLTFKRYHQEHKKTYSDFATLVHSQFGVTTKVKRYGVEIEAFGNKYVFSKDYVTDKKMMAGASTVFAEYILNKIPVSSSQIVGKYLEESDLEEIRRVAVEQFIILPTHVDIELKDKLLTLSLKRPKDWLEAMESITGMLGVDVPIMRMEKGDIIVNLGGKKIKKVEWKYDKDSVKKLVSVMCQFWEKDKSSNRKPDNQVVRGGGVTIVNLTKEQRDYREYVNGMVKKTLAKTTKVSGVSKINFSNTTTSCYVDFTNLGLTDIKVSIRDHEEMHENGYYRFYIDAVGREDFSGRLAVVLDALVKTKQASTT